MWLEPWQGFIYFFRMSRVVTGFAQVMKNQESHEILEFHFPRLESHGI